MNKIISISLLCLFISNSIFKAALIVNYWHNTTEIIADCCVNKNKPELNCDGKCYIDKKLNKIDSNTKEDVPSRILEKDFELFVTSALVYSVKFYGANMMTSEQISHQYEFDFSSKVFQPPTA